MLSQISNFDYEHENYIETKMNSASTIAYEKLNKALPSYLIEPLANLLISSWWENIEECEKIADLLDLEEDEIAALAQDKDWMRDILYDKSMEM